MQNQPSEMSAAKSISLEQ